MFKFSSITLLNQDKQKVFSFPLHYLLAFIIIASLVFGKGFTKFPIITNFYLHDILILLLCIIGFNKGKLLVREPSILIIIGLSVFYFIYSLFFFRNDPEFYFNIAIRQYGIFMYMAFAYIVFNTYYRTQNDLENLLKFIVWIGKVSYILTWVKILYIYLFPESESLFEFRFYSYIAVFGVITFCSNTLIYSKGIVKYLIYLSCLLLAILTKQAAFFLAVLTIGIVYYFFRMKAAHRITFLVIGLIGFGLLFLAPDFTDANVKWRLLYWRHILSNAVHHYFVFGNGFGLPYMTSDFSYYIEHTIHSSIMTPEYDKLARHINPPHNSFLTIVFHIGLLPALLLLWPIRRIFTLFIVPYHKNHIAYSLSLTLIGFIVWCSFNVILELPHSAIYFWLIYFITALFLKYSVEPFRSHIKFRTNHTDVTY